MSHLPPKPDFNYPARYPADPRQYPQLVPPPPYPPTPERYGPREGHIYPLPRSRVPPSLETHTSARPLYAMRRLPPPMDPYTAGYYSRHDEGRYRDRDHDRREDDHRLRPQESSRDRERAREKRERGDEARRGYDGERRERDPSRERHWARQKEEERERWARQQEDREREWSRLRDEDRRSGRSRIREPEPERMWVPRLSRSPPRRMVSAQPHEPSPAHSRARSPLAISSPRRTTATPVAGSSRSGSPYRVERSRPLRSRSPPGEIKLGNHSISLSRNSARPHQGLSPRRNDRDMRQPALRRSPSPDRPRRDVRREVSRGSRAIPSDYRGRDRRSPRRRSYSPSSPRRKRSPRPIKRRTPSPPSRSRSRSPTRTPPTKRHVLPPLKSPTRPPPPPPPTGPRVRPAPQYFSHIDPDGDIAMDEPVVATPEAKAEPLPLHPPAVPASPRIHPVTPAPASPAAKPASTSMSTWPDMEVEKKFSYARRRSRSPPTGPRQHHNSIPSNKSPDQTTHVGPNLPSKPDWVRRNANREPPKQETAVSAPRPTTPAAPSEPVAFNPVIPAYQPKPSVTADIEAELARVRAHRAHIEHEYIRIAKDTRRALSDLMLADIDLKNAEARRAVSSAQLEKARSGKLGVDFIAG